MEQLSDKIYSATNGGKDIILSLFPDSSQSFEGRKNFSIRPDDINPSASVKQAENGIWFVTEFTLGEKFNGISLYGWVKGMSWTDSLKELASIYNIDDVKPTAKFNYSERKAKKDEVDGEKYFKYHDKLLPYHLAVYGPITTLHACEIAKAKGCNSYTTVKDGKARTFEATPDYPIIVYDFGTWRKIYQPKAHDKKYRFLYDGDKPKNYIFGWDNVLKERLNLVNEKSENADRLEKPLTQEDIDRIKLPMVVIASGDSDGINFLSLGIPTVWMNSENVSINEFNKLVAKLSKLAHKVINVPDLDKTGLISAAKKALANLQLFNMYLPEKITESRDFRGNARKDFKDFISLRYQDAALFKNSDTPKTESGVDKFRDSMRKEVGIMLNTSIRCQFWKAEYTKSGNFSKFKFDYESCIYFLKCSGFFIYKDDQERTFVHRSGHILKRIEAQDIRTYIIQFLRDGNYSQDLRNFILEKNVISKDRLFTDLPEMEIEMTRSGKDFQLLHFQNISWKITKDGIETIQPKICEYLVWESEIIPHNAYTKPTEMEWEIDSELSMPFMNKFPEKPSCKILEFISLTSNMYWQKEANVLNLKSQDQMEVFHHLFNKMFSIGYMFHTYKQSSKAWAVWLMENEIITNGESAGGTGKSLFVRIISELLKSKFIPARKMDDWPYDGINKNHRLYWFDDCDKRFNFHEIFPNITGDLTASDKGGRKYSIPFKESGKHIFTSNYAPNNMDGSTERRIVYCMMSDYFHSKSEEKGFDKGFTAEDHFGKELFTDFDQDEWNYYFNTIALCIQFYFQFGQKLNPPLLNAQKRELVSYMGENFKDWADDYFGDPEINGSKFNNYLVKKEVYDASPNKSAHQFTKSMKAWCKFYGYDFNPQDVKYFNLKHGYMAKDGISHIYIRTDIKEATNSELDHRNNELPFNN